MAPSRRVRVPRIVHKRKILRLLSAINRQQKGVFLLIVVFWHMKPEYWPEATKGEFNLEQKKDEYLRV